MYTKIIRKLLILLMFYQCPGLGAQLSLSPIFTSHMVLQRDSPIQLWGWEKSEDSVYVSFRDSVYVTNPDSDGKWMVCMSACPAGGPYSMTVKGSGEIILEDIRLGDVWLCAGQSNMYFSLKNEQHFSDWKEEEIRQEIRIIKLDPDTAHHPSNNFQSSGWSTCTVENAKDFSAVALYFGSGLSEQLPGVPLGLIQTAYGSSTAESWISSDSLLTVPWLNNHLLNFTSSTASKNPSTVYNAMLYPLFPLAVKGVIWYQGESNVLRASQYKRTLEMLRANLRAGFSNPALPFYIVQIPPYNYAAFQQEPGIVNSAALLREAQFLVSFNDINSHLICTTDLGDPGMLHPKDKLHLGERIAQTVLANEYDRNDYPASSPYMTSYKISKYRIILHFSNAKSGFSKPDGPLSEFVIAGTDHNFYPAEAQIRRSKIIVFAPEGIQPAAVRFGWSNTAQPNLFSNDGLPVVPFRTDQWDHAAVQLP